MRILKIAKDPAVKARVQAINQLKAILVNADPARRDDLTPLSTRKLIARCAELNIDTQHDLVAATRHTLRQLACRTRYLNAEIHDVETRITQAVKATAPQLLDIRGIGPDSAATLLIAAGDNPDRLARRRPSPPAAVSALSKRPPSRRIAVVLTGDWPASRISPCRSIPRAVSW